MQDVKLFTQLLGIAEPNSRFTVLMERMVIDMQKEIMCISSVTKLAGITYSEAEGIIGRAVNRGLSRRVKRQVFEIGFDEKAHKKGHIHDVRKQENTELSRKGNDSLKGTKFAWLYNAKNIDGRSRRWFHELLGKGLKTARAWSIKELAGSLWDYISPTWTEKAWKKLSKTIKSHFHGIMNAVRLKADNADAESMNPRIERIKNRVCGFRNVQNFVNAIYFHLGGLDLYPASPTR